MASLRTTAGLLLGAGAWTASAFALYDGTPPALAWKLGVLPVLLVLAGAWLAFVTGKWKEPSGSVLVAAVVLLAGAGWGARLWLAPQQAVSGPALKRVFLDRRADASGNRPRSNFRFRSGSYRTVEMVGQIANDNDFPLWEVTLRIRFFYRNEVVWEQDVVFRADIPAGGTGVVTWAKMFTLEELPPEPAWEAEVVGARCHGGARAD